ncbi:unnamed protein product [Linum trigynum]|uniref:Uncharacterized protein n=1 Tax=Linum trigynum TaxID=586398 RepID=A0AAV2GTH3_9ROSI
MDRGKILFHLATKKELGVGDRCTGPPQSRPCNLAPRPSRRRDPTFSSPASRPPLALLPPPEREQPCSSLRQFQIDCAGGRPFVILCENYKTINRPFPDSETHRTALVLNRHEEDGTATPIRQ